MFHQLFIFIIKLKHFQNLGILNKITINNKYIKYKVWQIFTYPKTFYSISGNELTVIQHYSLQVVTIN